MKLVLASLAVMFFAQTAHAESTIGLGDFATCAITAKKQVACWGLGSDMPKYPPDLVRSEKPQVIAGLSNVVQLAVGYRYGCALDGAGAVTCWGMLDPDADKVGGAKPAKVAKLADIAQIGVGKYEACARTKAGEVWCWGQVDGSKQAKEPLLVKKDAVKMAVGRSALCVIGKDAKVECSGGAGSGGFGTPLTEWKPMPKLGAAVDVVANTGLACALHADGSVACDGDKLDRLAAGLKALKKASALSVSDDSSFACALEAGKARCWGESYAAQLGDGVVAEHDSRGPVDAKLSGTITELVVGPANACARAGGKLQCWGADGKSVVKTPKTIALP